MKLKIYLLIVITFLVNSIPIFNWFEVSFRSKFTKGNSKAKETFFVSPILKTFLVFITAFVCLTSNAQNYKPFTIRYNNELKGNMLLIGNNILGKDNNALSDNSVNQSTNMQYIDIDSDAATFSSSSANLKMPATTSCFKIAYAGLYWGAILQVPQSRTDVNKIKLKLPGNTNYTDITGELIYDAIVAPIAAGTNEPTNTPYACYADVTTLVSALANPQGTFTVANVTSSLGFNSSTGLSAGWTLFVVYEDTNATTKSITTFDGFSSIYDDKTLSIPISGFKTPPSGVIDILYAFASLEGDKGEIGSKTEINGKAIVNAPQRASNKFFNSAITDANGYFTDRVPSNSNTLGYDTGIESILGAEKSVINHGATSATITVQVAKGQADPVFSFFNAFAVDVIAPDIALTKTVEDASGNDASNANVTLGQNLYYEINYQNIGNDNVANFTIKDILPENIIFNYPGDIDLTNSGGATVQSYDPLTRTIIFSIPNTSVEISDPKYTIRIKVQVVPTCNELSNACSNEIKNQAFATYRGIVNTTQITDDASFSATICNFGTAQPTNFLVGITNCTFQRTEVLCGASVVLSASDGYASYSWSTSPTGTPVIGTAQTYTATQTGVYYVRNTASGTCLSIDEEITVVPYGNTITNPVIPFADLLPICPNNGKVLPNIFLCGANATRAITTGISDAASIVWQKLNESSCAAVTVDNCANESSACTWNQVGTGPDYTADTAGQFRVTINYVGGCYSVFYFNVYQNVLNPTVTSQDIICNTLGEITVGGVPGGYEYSLNAAGPYQSSNVFSITTPNSYTVYIKQVGVVTNPCIFTVPDILIRERDFTVSKFVTQPLCNGDQGVIKLAANDARPQYYFSIHQGATLVNSVGPIMASDYEFSGLNPGIYTARVWTDDGCDYSENIEIINPPLLTATSALTKPLTCVDGEITVYPVGGTPPYTYYINGTENFQSTPQIAVTNPLPAGGIYNIIVEDSKGCSATTTITVAVTPPPVYTVSQTDVKCYNDTTGAINFNVTNANGYTLAYSIDNGTTYVANPSFSNLSAGTYNAIVKYSLAGTDCFSTAQTITITQPSTALTASAGVSELAGCGPSGEGKIRITNPQGGTAPYEYSFDNQVTWTTVNEAYKASGTYTVYIRDANGCIFAMPNIIIDPIPVEPTIEVQDPAYNCDGTTKSNVTVTTVPNANYSYQYLLDGAANTNVPSNVFTNLTTGNHTISVKYISTTSALSCIPQSDFFIVVPSGNAFIASISGVKNLSCSGTNNGEITIAAQNFDPTKGFQYSIDNGVNWFTQMTSPYTITGLANGTYDVKVRYDVTSTGSCVQSFTQILTAPTPLVTTAGVTSLATCTVGATITASSTGGTTAYRYELWNSTGTVNVQSSQNTGIFTNVAPGTYIVRGYDANNCTDDTVVLTIVTPPIVTATLDPSSDLCFDSVNQASLVVNASGGTSPYVYSLDGAPAQNSNTFSNVGVGTHTIVVTDSFGCAAVISNITIAPQLTVAITNIKTLDCTASPNAVITGTITGGNAPFVVTVLSGTGPGTIAQPTATTFTYTTAVASTYQFQIQDAQGCSTTVTASINPLVPVTATLNSVNPSCNGFSDGSVQITPSGGVGPYTYSFNGSIFTSTSLYSGLSAGIAYAYEVRDSKNCPFTGTVTLTQPTALVASATATAFSCSATNTKQSATITIAVPVTGTAPYQYSFNGGGYTDTNTLTVNDNGTDQPIPYSVRDANGCTDGDSVTLLKLNPPIAGTIGTTAVTCIVTTSTVTVTPSIGTGVGTLTYEITFPLASATSNTTGVFTGLLPGTYIFKVTDANGCYYTQSHNVLPVTPIAVSGNVTSDVLCKGGNTGSAAFTVSGYSGTYTSSLTNGTGTLVQSGNTVNLTNLIAGSYTLQVTDNATGCTANASVTITEPTAALTFTANATNVNCNNDNSQITVTRSGGTPNYTYAAVIASAAAPTIYGNSNIITVDTNSGANLSWDVYVKDANGCVTNNTLLPTTVTLDPLPTVSTPALASNQCSVSTGFTFTASGTGIAPLSYSINNGASYQSSPVFTVNVPGSYTVTVKDGNGCTATSVTPTIVSSPLTTNAVLAKDLTCSSPTDATIDVTTNGGKLPYSYKVKIGTGGYGSSTAFVGNIFTYTASTADRYQFEIKDANGCTKETNITTTTAVLPTATYTAVDPTCNGNSDGSIKLTALTGEGPFTYSINGGATFVATNVFGGLVAGSYPYVVRDNKGCDATGTIPLNNPVLIVPNIVMYPIVCNANTPGSFDVSVTTGGVAPFTYNLYDSSYNLLDSYSEAGASPTAVHNFGGLTFGDYYITIVDAKGCQFSSSKQRITTPPFLTLNAVTLGGDCIVGATVDLTVVTGGVAPYTYSIFGQPLTESAPTVATTYTFNGLLHGNSYFFQVKDNNNCISVLEVPIPAISSIGVVIDNKSNVTCNGANNGIINYTVSGFDATVTTIEYELLNPLTNSPISPAINGTITGVAGGPTSGIISGLKPGDYLLKVKESTGTLCSALIPFNINQPIQSLNATISNETNANCNTGTQITVSATGGTGPYQYAFVQDGALQAGAYNTSNLGVLNPLPLPLKLNWDIWVKDANGCEFKIDKTITIDPSPTINPVGLQCFTGSPLSITLTGTYVGIPTYSIGGAYQASPTFTVNAPGVYNVSIKDANGCIAATTYEVKPQVLLQADLMQDLTCAVDASITLTPSRGTGTYTTYEVSFNGGAYAPAISPFITNTAGSYVFRVTDSQGCPAISNEIIVTPNTTPTLTFTQANVSCNGGSNGSIVVTAAAGIAPYQYSIDNGVTFQPLNVFTGLNAAGTYNVIVKDSKNCISAPTSISITQPNALSATSLMTTSLSCGAGNAAQPATVTVTGVSGTAPYRYSYNGGTTYTSSNTYQSYTGITFDVWVKDANGCLFTLMDGVDIPPLNPPTDLDFLSTAVTCSNLTSTVTLTPTNGVGVLTYTILPSLPAAVTQPLANQFAGLLPGTYLFQVTDANGCTYQEAYTVNPVTNITVSGQLMSNVTCNPGANGEVQFTVANFAGNYSYSLDGGTTVFTGQTNPTITVSGLTSANTQTIIVTDETTGCTATTSINVAQPAPLTLVANPFINANCNFGAQVSVTASGGVAPYSYSYVPSGNPVGTYSNSANAVLDPAMATSWDVYVKDANGCVITTPLAITIVTDPLPSGITVTGLSQCPSATGTYTFTVNVTTGMAPFEYSIGTGFQASPTFTVNAAGTYDVTVKDKNGCTTTVSGLVNILPALQLQAAITALPSCTDGDGALTLTATGGSGTYEYSIDSGTPQSSANFTAIASGSHTVTVRDVTTNCTKSIPVNLGAATPITGFALSKTDVSCNGGSNGVITATMTTPAPGVNDNPVYNYSLSGTAIRPAQLSNIFSGLTAGNYTVTVTSARGCVATQTITVIEPAIISVPAPTVAQFGCNSGSNAMNFATITVTGVTGGSGVYNYEFIKGGTVVQFGVNNIYTESNLLGGTFAVNVYDSKACIGTAPATISIVPFITLDKVTVNVDRAITCTNQEDITVTVSSIGGIPASLQYTLVDYNATTGVSGALYPSRTNATGVFTGLNVGNYLITVVNPATGCSVKSVHYVNEPNTFDLTINSVTDVSCFGGTNGSVNVTLIDRVITATNPNQAGAFSYTIVDALGNPVTSGSSATAGPLTISALAAGPYTITATLTNSPFCTVSKNFTITQPTAALAIAETHTQITCVSGNNDGSISATATGGWPGGYQFELTGPLTVAYSAQSSFTNLTAGTYTVNVRDSKGCVASTNVTLVIPTPITVTAGPNTTMLSCFGDKTATITVNSPSGGQGSNYSYTLNTTSLVPSIASGPQASPVFGGLGAGTYTITVTDGYSCSATSAPIIIAQPTKVNASLVVAATQTCLTQTRLTLSATGGTGTYTYSTNAAFTTVLGSFATSTTFPVPVGTYVYYVKDANGCISNVSNQIKIDPLPALTINLDRTNAVINCAGDNTGVIVATAQGGLGNYSYTLLNGSGAIVQGPTASGNFTGLFAGNYQVKVDSGDCTTLSSMISITQPAAPLTATYVTQEVSCNGANNGVFTVNASGGTGIIKYAISPNLNQFLDTNIFDKLAPGNYDVIVQDVLGCYVKINFDITEPAPIVASTIPGTILPEICFGDKDGAFMIEVTGGVSPYSVSLDNPNGTYTTGTATQTQFDFTGLTGGSHTVYIRDANACSVEWVVALPESVKINPIAVVDYSCVNNAANNTVTVTVDASITNPADLDYSLDGASYQMSNVFTNVVPGPNHYIDVRHTNGCIQRTANFEILQVDPLALVLNDGGLNEIVATATGGGGGYQYTFNGESNGTKNTFIIYKSGDYTVEVTDVNGCVASATRYFEYIDVCIPNYFTPNGDGISDGWAPGCTVNYKDLTFDIFDRYGRKIATYRLGEYWDGKYNGQELPSGDYWYVLRLNDPKDNREFVGHFTLYR